MNGDQMLIVGIGSLAIVLGYMTGASSSPVASVVIPAVFGLAATAFTLLQATLTKGTADVSKESSSQEFRTQSDKTSWRVGMSLVVFSIFFLLSVVMGAKVRIDELLAPSRHQHTLRWVQSSNKPPTVNSALAWMALEAKLVELGYDKASIDSLYAINEKTWETAGVANPPVAVAPASGASAVSDSQQILIDQFLRQKSANPLANQPPKIDKNQLQG